MRNAWIEKIVAYALSIDIKFINATSSNIKSGIGYLLVSAECSAKHWRASFRRSEESSSSAYSAVVFFLGNNIAWQTIVQYANIMDCGFLPFHSLVAQVSDYRESDEVAAKPHRIDVKLLDYRLFIAVDINISCAHERNKLKVMTGILVALVYNISRHFEHSERHIIFILQGVAYTINLNSCAVVFRQSLRIEFYADIAAIALILHSENILITVEQAVIVSTINEACMSRLCALVES